MIGAEAGKNTAAAAVSGLLTSHLFFIFLFAESERKINMQQVSKQTYAVW